MQVLSKNEVEAVSGGFLNFGGNVLNVKVTTPIDVLVGVLGGAVKVPVTVKDIVVKGLNFFSKIWGG